MSSLGMQGPYELNSATISAVVTRTSPGNYALGTKNDTGAFAVYYVGRSDTDVRGRLISWVGNTKRPLFKFSYSTSPKAAFEKECENYHDFKPSDNNQHPGRPTNTNWKCPKCVIFD